MRRILTIIFATMVAFGFSASMAYADIGPGPRPTPWPEQEQQNKDDDSCAATPLRNATEEGLLLLIIALLVSGGVGGMIWQDKRSKADKNA